KARTSATPHTDSHCRTSRSRTWAGPATKPRTASYTRCGRACTATTRKTPSRSTEQRGHTTILRPGRTRSPVDWESRPNAEQEGVEWHAHQSTATPSDGPVSSAECPAKSSPRLSPEARAHRRVRVRGGPAGVPSADAHGDQTRQTLGVLLCPRAR